MVWPTNPEFVSEIPHTPQDSWKIEIMSPDAKRSLVDGMPNMAHILEAITQGDPAKECALGGLLFTVANRAANGSKRSTQTHLRGLATG